MKKTRITFKHPETGKSVALHAHRFVVVGITDSEDGSKFSVEVQGSPNDRLEQYDVVHVGLEAIRFAIDREDETSAKGCSACLN